MPKPSAVSKKAGSAAPNGRVGSEQVTSNFLIANSGDPVLLPYAKYRNYWGDKVPDGTSFLHFVGTHRYSRMKYASYTRRAIDRLGQRSGSPAH